MSNLADFRSDTVTKPTPAMREAMANAVVGDDVLGDDPTVVELEKYCADLLGKEAGLFVASGVMGNQVAILTHANPGEEVIAGHNCHIVQYETGAAARVAGVQLRTIDQNQPHLTASSVDQIIRKTKDVHFPKTGLICVEQATCAGTVVALTALSAIKKVAESYNVPVHMDGARFFNACLALGCEPKELSGLADSVSICLSKGLAAPIGSILLGQQSFIEQARRNRKMLGGGMRQVGVIAAAGMIGMTSMRQRLDQDHQHAKQLASQIADIPGFRISREVEINMVFVEIDSAMKEPGSLSDFLGNLNIKIFAPASGKMRLVLHNDIKTKDVDHLLDSLKQFSASNFKV
jgi:threonine aldolase